VRQFLHDHKLRAAVNRHQALVGFIACLVIVGFTIGYVARESAHTKHALCALRGDLQQRIDSSTRFLVEHPQGIPGVSPKLIRDGIQNQRRTVHALRSLHCD
jgi:hypothetical protein